ncbi:MAG: hypothetical protein H6Q68_2883 [Firmicutes bacterium]|nr:hypothetical protein [Bacillota bacterium]
MLASDVKGPGFVTIKRLSLPSSTKKALIKITITYEVSTSNMTAIIIYLSSILKFNPFNFANNKQVTNNGNNAMYSNIN